jgi:hypothetical protein
LSNGSIATVGMIQPDAATLHLWPNRTRVTVWVPTMLSWLLTCCSPAGSGRAEVRHLAAGEPGGQALSELVSLRLAYLVVVRVFGLLAEIAYRQA